ncbi:MAG TPA: type II toxin-antitoxin system RelE/ParE family toxin [Azospirillaceae bacterium]|nr:type II toxin-antitoxin system RelE/ParE family toxin [Azospirillaceae bacterium]
MRVVWTRRAVRDVAAHIDYISQFNPVAANEIAAGLMAAASNLALFPHRGRPGPGGTRDLTVVHPYVIVYEVDREVVTVLRVWHGAQDR